MTTLAPSFLIVTSSFFQETRTCLKAWMSLNFNKIRPLTTESMYNIFNTLAPSFLIGSSSFLQVSRRTKIKFWMRSKFSQIQPRTAKLTTLDQLQILNLLENYSKYFDDLLAVR